MSNNVRSAVECARAGLRVFEVKPHDKQPLLKGWQRRATDDPAAVEAMWATHPEANIGVACGSGLIVIDADTEAGEAQVRDLGVGDTATARTGRGRHFYMQGDARNSTDLLPGVDVRGKGGYVVGPGSLHPSGAEYRWEIPPWEVPPAPIPPALLSLLTSKPVHRAPPPPPVASETGTIEAGKRNVTLFSLACSLRGRHSFGHTALSAALHATNTERCRPPLDREEVEKLVQSAASYPNAPAWATEPVVFAVDPHLRPRARQLLIVLTSYADHQGVCWPSIVRLAADTGMAKNTVEAASRN